MEKEFIPYEQSLELKELGFDEPCFAFYNGKFLDFKIQGGDICSPYLSTENRGECPNAPTFSQTFRWFREKYNLVGVVQYFTRSYYCYTVNDMKNTEKSNMLFTEFEMYEEAELACLKKLIGMVKNK
jgi:hypothetical protein